jgi:rRNA-processing protein FCF1
MFINNKYSYVIPNKFIKEIEAIFNRSGIKANIEIKE